MFPNPRDLAWIKLKNLSFKTEHYHTGFFLLQKSMALFLALFGQTPSRSKCCGKNCSHVSLFSTFLFFLCEAENRSIQRSDRGDLFAHPNNPRHPYAALWLYPVSQKVQEWRTSLHDFLILFTQGKKSGRLIKAQEVKCVTCWGERACPMFWATSVDWSQQMRGPRDRTWKDCRNEIPIAQLQPRTHNTRTISDEALCIWGKIRKG